MPDLFSVLYADVINITMGGYCPDLLKQKSDIFFRDTGCFQKQLKKEGMVLFPYTALQKIWSGNIYRFPVSMIPDSFTGIHTFK